MKKKIISIFLSILMTVLIVPLSGSFTEASALEKLDVLIWNPGSLYGSSDEALADIIDMYDNLNLNCYSSCGNYTLSQINQKYDLSELGFIMVYLPTSSISTADQSLLKEFNEAGIHIMFVGEHSGFSSSGGNINGNISSAAKNLGFNVSFSSSSDTTSGVGVAVPINSDSPLFKNVTELAFVFACEITQTDNATEKLLCENKVCFAGKQIDNGYISVISDCSVFKYSNTEYYHASKENITNFLFNCYEIGKNSLHTYETVVTAPTCTEQGYTTHTCTDCGYSYKSNYVNALGHDMGWETVVEPTCTTDGLKVYGCSRCEVESYTALLNSSTYPQSPHSYSNNMNKTYNFSYEGADKLILTFSSSTQFENNYDYLYIYDGNGTQIGKYTGTSLASKVITITGDSFSLKLTTDSSQVYYGFSFSKIEAYFDCAEVVLPATGHTEEILPAVEPTCTQTGLTEGKKCTVCGETLVAQTVIDALGHTEEVIAGVEATCTQTGLTEGKKCTVCGETLVAQTVIDALGHTEEVIKGVKPTCIDDGISDGIKCSVCDEILKQQETLPPTGHKRVTVPGKAPTCTADGYTDSVKCSVCNEVLVEPSVLKASHSKTTIAAKAPTCTETGYTEGVKCAICDQILVAPSVVGTVDHCDNDADGYCDYCSLIIDQELVSANCTCACHGNNFFFKIILFFQKLFGFNKYCVCGIAH